MREALGSPVLHHRTPEFKTLFESIRARLKKVFQTQNEVLCFASTGTGMMEAAVANLCSRNDRVLSINGGKFGARFREITKVYGVACEEIYVERGQSVEIAEIRKILETKGPFQALFFQASETSTGAKHPTQEIAALCQEFNILCVCDAITALGVFDVPMDAWGIDCLMSASQKAFMLPPGLAFVSLSKRGWEAAEKGNLPRFYFDYRKERKAHLENQTAWTPATGLIQGLDVSLDLMLHPSLNSLFQRHSDLAAASRKICQMMGLELLADKSPSEALTAVKVPPSILDGKRIPKLMRDSHRVVLTGGQDELEGKIFRISHFGFCFHSDLKRCFLGLLEVLPSLGMEISKEDRLLVQKELETWPE